MRHLNVTVAVLAASVAVGSVFQNCSKVDFQSGVVNSAKCGEISTPCDLVPLVDKAGVVTILLALGDQVGAQLVVKGASSQLIAETMVRYASPVLNPRILVVKDFNNQGESAYDTAYIADVLLGRYNTTYIEEREGGLSGADVAAYDLVWFNNPGHPMGSIQSRDTLIAFKGGVILSGDDLSRGSSFDLSALTGLNYVNNGTEVVCNGNSYSHDNNGGYQFSVSIDGAKIPGVESSVLDFSYGNDIDLSIAAPSVEVIASAVGGGPDCVESRPVIVRYEK